MIHSLQDDMADCHPSESIVDLGSVTVDNVLSEAQSAMQSRKRACLTPGTHVKRPRLDKANFNKCDTGKG